MSPYHPTSRICFAMASTVGGQRRILKHHGSVVDYIRKAVDSGVYRTKEELEIVIKQRKDGIEDLRVIMDRLRQDIVRGSHIQDYPTEYLILEQHPPILDPPRTPVRILRQLRPPPNPLHKLTKKYLKRYERQTSSSILSKRQASDHTDPHTGGPVSSEEYYRRLLGVQQAANATSSSSYSTGSNQMLGGPTMYQKPVVVQKAYTAAVLHYDLLQKQQHDPSAARGNDNIMKQVDEMLSQQVSYEQSVARERRNNIMQHALENSSADIDTPSSLSKKLINRDKKRNKSKPIEKTKEDQNKTEPAISANEPFPFAKLGMDTSKPFFILDGNDGTASVNAEDESETATKHTKSDEAQEEEDDDDDPSNTMDSIFHSDPNTIEGMMRWSERLNAVPYAEWTIGASTALDHWIARQVLKLSELTWQSTLEGYDAHHLNIGRDIVACREAIFPETIVHANRMQQEMDSEAFDDMKSSTALEEEKVVDEDQNLFGVETSSKPSLMGDFNETRSIEDLLQRLGGLRSPDAAVEPLIPMPSASAPSVEEEDDIADLDLKMNKLVNELQNWRRRNVEVPYDQWEQVDQQKFHSWMKKYVKTVSTEAEKRYEYRSKGQNDLDMVDYEETRIALLADPPVSPDESNEFWSQLQDESMIEILLDNMIDDGPPPGASILHKSFWDLPRNTQMEQLLNLGAIRPLLDEYTKETDRLRFLQRYGDVILTGVPLEHLVPDPTGPIKTSDLSRDIVTEMRIGDQERFRLETLPYKAFTADTNDDETDQQQQRKRHQDAFEKSRALFKAWNAHKAGRARYEEKLFQSGRLGLRYNDELDINAKKSKTTGSTTSTSGTSRPSSRRQS
jgi:hypothetical protein